MAGNLDQKFEDKVNSVAQHADETSKGQINEGQVAWDTLADGGPNNPGPERFLKSFRDEFERTVLGKEYVRLNSEKSTDEETKSKVSEVAAVRMQYDWLMQVERDFLMRKRSRLRSEAHATAIREMIGHEDGPVIRGILRVAKQMQALAGKGTGDEQ